MKNVIMVASALLAGTGAILLFGGNDNGAILEGIAIGAYAFGSSMKKKKKYKCSITEEQFNEVMNEFEPTKFENV